MSDIKYSARQNRVFELRVLGLTIPQIKQKMNEENYRISERTIWSELHSDAAQQFVNELIRRQLADITLADEDLSLRLKYRDKLIDKFLPQKRELTVEGGKQPIVLKPWEPSEDE